MTAGYQVAGVSVRIPAGQETLLLRQGDAVPASADASSVAWLAERGYITEVDDIDPGPIDSGTVESVDLDGMTVKQLHEYADALGVALGDAKRKQDIIDALRVNAE